jgi:hypothetical protein
MQPSAQASGKVTAKPKGAKAKAARIHAGKRSKRVQAGQFENSERLATAPVAIGGPDKSGNRHQHNEHEDCVVIHSLTSNQNT